AGDAELAPGPARLAFHEVTLVALLTDGTKKLGNISIALEFSQCGNHRAARFWMTKSDCPEQRVPRGRRASFSERSCSSGLGAPESVAHQGFPQRRDCPRRTDLPQGGCRFGTRPRLVRALELAQPIIDRLIHLQGPEDLPAGIDHHLLRLLLGGDEVNVL